MAITTCAEFRTAEQAIDHALQATLRPVDEKFVECLDEAQSLFDARLSQNPSNEAFLRDLLQRDQDRCRRKHRMATDKILRSSFARSDLLKAEARKTLAWQEQLIIASTELEADALAAQKSLDSNLLPRPHVILVKNFKELEFELSQQRCAIFLTLITIVENGKLRIGDESLRLGEFATTLTGSARFTVDEVVTLSGRRAGTAPSKAERESLRKALHAGAVEDDWLLVGPATRLTARNRLLRTDPVVNCTIEIDGRTVGKTDKVGTALLRAYSFPDKVLRLTFSPEFSSTGSPTGRVGPATTPPKNAKDRIWRKLECDVLIKAGRIVAASGSGDVSHAASTNKMKAGLQPIWMKSQVSSGWAQVPDMIVLHSPASPRAASTFLRDVTATRANNAHYFVDLDGNPVKLVYDVLDRCAHAGESTWREPNGSATITQLNGRSIGIEIDYLPGTTKGSKFYSDSQMAGVIRLVEDLKSQFGISRERIVGHGDIGTTNGIYGRRGVDPGPEFDWNLLRVHGLGISVQSGPPAQSALLTFFDAMPNVKFRDGDSDVGKIYAGKRRATAPAGLITFMQSRLIRIGYSCCPGAGPRPGRTPVPTGKYDPATRQAIKAFQVHFLRMPETSASYGMVDRRTAEMLQRVQQGPK
jgi:N-acetyl-anhydromuramyl-L-alanine amidase AmpD